MLKGLLQKARSTFEAEKSDELKVPVAPVAPKYQQHLDLIVVPQSATDALPEDPNPLVEAVVDYVNYLLKHAHFNRFEIPAEALQAYHTDYYLAQVSNGGHSQFVANSKAALAYTLSDAIAGLSAIKATQHLELVQSMSDWIAANPDQVETQTGFDSGVADELSQLDSPFFTLEKSSPVRMKLAQWLEGLEILQVVDDDLMPRVMAGIKTLNPHGAERRSKARITKLINQLSNPVHLGLGMASASAKRVEPVIQVGNGSYRKVDGSNAMTWALLTSEGRRFGIVDNNGAQLREYIEESLDENEDGTKAFTPTSVGTVIQDVPAQKINVAKNVCNELDAAIAIGMMLGKLNDDTQADFLSVCETGMDEHDNLAASIFVVANKGSSAFSAIVTEQGARLLAEPSHAQLATVSREEIGHFVENMSAD